MERGSLIELGVLYVVVLCVFWNFQGDGVIRGGGGVQAVSLEEDLWLTKQEKAALDKFRPKMFPLLPHKWMRQDIYLMRWLRARDLNLAAAEQMLRSNLQWRKEQKIDTIEDEDWSDMKDDYPYTNDTFDRTGRPIGTINLGVWNVRRAALAGQMPRLSRYMVKLLEEATQAVVRQQMLQKNVTQFKVLINLEGFNQIQHACALCLPSYVTFMTTYEERYPGHADQIININTPPIYDIVLNLIRPIFSPATQRAAVYLGEDKKIWMKYLDKEISREERRPEFGGVLKE